VVRPAPSLLEICICQKDFIGRKCEFRIESLSVADKLKYGCELSPCYAGSVCEDRPFGNFVCHCVAVNMKFLISLILLKKLNIKRSIKINRIDSATIVNYHPSPIMTHVRADRVLMEVLVLEKVQTPSNVHVHHHTQVLLVKQV